MINPLAYDHPGFIAAAYGLFFAVTGWFATGARLRLGRAARRLQAVDPRAARAAGNAARQAGETAQ